MEPGQSAVDDEDLEGPGHLGDSSKEGRHKHDEGDEDHSPLPEKKKLNQKLNTGWQTTSQGVNIKSLHGKLNGNRKKDEQTFQNNLPMHQRQKRRSFRTRQRWRR